MCRSVIVMNFAGHKFCATPDPHDHNIKLSTFNLLSEALKLMILSENWITANEFHCNKDPYYTHREGDRGTLDSLRCPVSNGSVVFPGTTQSSKKQKFCRICIFSAHNNSLATPEVMQC